MQCDFCNPPEKYKKFYIKEYKFWSVVLRINQNYLGWCLIPLKRHIEDLMDITPEEREELFQITKELRDSTRELFSPDMFNYASLGNIINHVHLQFIPRYSGEREFERVKFRDGNWGKNYSPFDPAFKVTEEVLIKIREAIQQKLG